MLALLQQLCRVSQLPWSIGVWSLVIASTLRLCAHAEEQPAVITTSSTNKVAAANQSEVAEFLPRPTAIEQKILAKLSDNTEVAFSENPLEEALNYLKDLHGIEIWIDKTAVSEAGLATDVPVNLNLSGVSLRSVLRLMLEPLGSTYIIEDEVLKVTSLKGAEKSVVTRTYPVGDLFSTQEEAEELVSALACGLGLVQKGNEAMRPLAISVRTGSIVTRMSRPQHDQLLQLLRDLREAKSLVVERSSPSSDASRPRLRAGNTSPNPTPLDEFSPGQEPESSQPRSRDPQSQTEEASPGAPPKAKAAR